MNRKIQWLISGLVLTGLLALAGIGLVVGEIMEAEACCVLPPPACGEFGQPECE